MRKISIDPITRLEGHGRIDLFLNDEGGLENAYMVVFASGQNTDHYVDPSGYLHTNFKLTTGGEYLALVMPNATTAHRSSPRAIPSSISTA